MNYQPEEASTSPSSPFADRSEQAPGADFEALALAMRGVWRAMSRNSETCSRLEGLQREQFWVLGTLAHGGGQMRMSDLAEQTGVSSASLTGIIDRLEEHGLVARERSEEDRRVVMVGVTTEGRASTRHVHDAFMQRLGELLEPLSAEQRQTLRELLETILRSERSR